MTRVIGCKYKSRLTVSGPEEVKFTTTTSIAIDTLQDLSISGPERQYCRPLDCVHRDLLSTSDYEMNGTPRLRSSYPSTPGSGQRTYDIRNTPPAPRPRTSLPNVPNAAPATAAPGSGPLVSVHLVEAPTQRFYIALIYGLLVVWCLYDWLKLVEEETQSIWLFFKWTCTYALLSYGIPLLRIPWLEWSYSMSNFSFLAHASITFILMFRIPVRYSYRPCSELR